MTELADQTDIEERAVLGGVARELRLVFRPPFEELLIVIVNSALLIAAWFWLSPELVARYTSLIFLPAAIASWAFADVPATNLFGADPAKSLPILDNPPALLRMFTIKNVVLWLLISPACVVLSVALAPSQDNFILSAAVVIAVLCMPFGYLGICSLVAPYLPFHKMPLRERRERRDTWWRYGIALIIPYVLTTPAAIITVAPAALWIYFAGQNPTNMFIAACIIAPWSFVVWRVALRVMTRLTERRRVWLTAFLLDTSRG